VVFWGGLPLAAQVSPGPLSKAHQSLDSPLKCAMCHSFGAGEAKLKCLNCHREIYELVKNHESMHGRVANRAKGDTDCARCHTEHYGERFRIFKWETSKEEFDHKQTGYPLVGKHAQLKCEECHSPKHISPEDRKHIMVHDLTQTFEGLHPACLTCHEDHHAGQLGAECQNCHDSNNWKAVKKFDHSTTHFPLTGKHEDVECAKCHKPSKADAKVIQYKGVDFASCTSCHQDPHHGSFEARCESCHNTGTWKRVHISSGNFDHSKTKFPLNGKHEGLACDKCHVNSDFKKPIEHEKCMDCHKDQHKGQFVSRADHGECGSCHTDAGWKPTTFTETSHQSTKYPLAGKHQGLDCAKCHTPAGLDTNYHPASQACSDCHKDAHAQQFVSAPHFNRCEDCHKVEGFHPSTFTLKQHQSSSFALKGAHAAVACQDCHRKEDAPAGADRRYHFGNSACEACHQDPHQAQFPKLMTVGLKQGQSVCEACHSLKSWHDLKSFDHGNTTFALMGRHQVLACVDCHRPVATAARYRTIPFQPAPERCVGCHEDIHAGQFQKGSEPVDCALCHDAVRWTAGLFNHESASTFSLAGAHDKVPCKLCHTDHKEINGRSVVIYRGTPRECAACHSK
jgi:predicted CXXCH cytochrome family protein